jgi:hypothetical protein
MRDKVDQGDVPIATLRNGDGIGEKVLDRLIEPDKTALRHIRQQQSRESLTGRADLEDRIACGFLRAIFRSPAITENLSLTASDDTDRQTDNLPVVNQGLRQGIDPGFQSRLLSRARGGNKGSRESDGDPHEQILPKNFCRFHRRLQ